MIALENSNEWNDYVMFYLREGNRPKFRSIFFQFHLTHQIEFFNHLHTFERSSFYAMVEPKEFALIFMGLEDKKQQRIIIEVDENYIVHMLEHMHVHHLVHFFRKLNEQECNYYMAFMKKARVRKIKTILSFGTHCAGAMMTTEYITAHPNETVQKVIARIKKAGKKTKSIYYVYVVTKTNTLIGVVSLRRLLTASSEQTMKLIMKEQIITVRVHTHNRMIEKIVDTYHLGFIPVVSKDNNLLGIVIVNDTERLHWIRQSYHHTKQKNFSHLTLLKKKNLFMIPIFLSVLFMVGITHSKLTMENTIIVLLISLLGAGVTGAFVTQKSLNTFDTLTDKMNEKSSSHHECLKREILSGLIMTFSCSVFSGIIVFTLTNGTHISIVMGIALFLAIFSSTIFGVLFTYFLTQKHDFSKNGVISMNTVITAVISFTITITLFQFM